MPKSRISRVVLLVSIFLYIASLPFVAYVTDKPSADGGMRAFHLLLVGPLGLILGEYSWLANPLMGIGWAFHVHNRPSFATASAFLALVLVLNFLHKDQVVVSEAPTYANIAYRSTGYWLWLASATVLFLGSAVATALQERPIGSKRHVP